jgi:hypothetical protein
LLVWFLASPVSVTAGNNTGRQAGESKNTLALLSHFIRARVARFSTVAAGIVALLVSTTVSWLCVFEYDEGAFFPIYCAVAGTLVGAGVGTLVADWAVADFFGTLNRDKIAIVANANTAKRAKDAWRKDDNRGRIVYCGPGCISGLYEMDDVMDAFSDAARSVMHFMEARHRHLRVVVLKVKSKTIIEVVRAALYG